MHIRHGVVSSINASNCTVRVSFLDRENVVSAELPVLTHGSFKNKHFWMPNPDESVVCVFTDSKLIDGFVIGSFYTEEDTPPVADPNKYHISFSDGTVFEYDTSTKKLLVDAKGQIELKASTIKIVGDVVVDGTVTSNQFITKSN